MDRLLAAPTKRFPATRTKVHDYNLPGSLENHFFLVRLSRTNGEIRSKHLGAEMSTMQLQTIRQIWQACCGEDQMAINDVMAENATLVRGDDEVEESEVLTRGGSSLRRGARRLAPQPREASEDEELNSDPFDGADSDPNLDSESEPSCDDDIVTSSEKEGFEPTEPQEPQPGKLPFHPQHHSSSTLKLGIRTKMQAKLFEDDDNLAVASRIKRTTPIQQHRLEDYEIA